MCDIDARLSDLLMQFSEMCAPKYNSPELSDRVLLFDIMPDGWETASILSSVLTEESITEPKDNTMLDSVSITSGKRSLEHSEEPNQKRVKTNTEITKQQDANPPEIAGQIVSGNIDQIASERFQEGGEHTENKTEELADAQTESNQNESPPLQEVVVSEKCAPPSRSSGEIHNQLKQEPLRQHKIYIHSLWLSVQSTYFRSLLHSSGMKETHDTDVHLKISESEEQAHLLLLKAMYHSAILNEKSVDELLAVFELADKYDVKFVFRICKLLLQKYATTFEISTKIMHMIKVKHNMNDVEDLAATLQLFLAKEFSPLDKNWESENFSNLSKPSLKYLLSSDDLIVVTENTVFHALMYWMEKNKIDADSFEETNDLLAVVRFKLVTFDYLYNVIKKHPVASKMPKFNQLLLDGMIYHAAPSEQKGMLEKLQPVQRKKSGKNIIVHTYLLTAKPYDARDRRNFQLETFWACGYKMSVDIIYKSGTYLNPEHYELQLTVHILNKESLVPLKFSVGQSKTPTTWQAETFKLKSSRKKCAAIDLNVILSGCTLFVSVAPS